MEIERRRLPRHRVYKRVKTIFNNNASSCDCLLRNLSDGGALINFPDPNWVPKNFLLHDELEGYSVNCAIVRRLGDAVGVKFVGPIQKDAASRKQSVTVSVSREDSLPVNNDKVAYSVYPAKFGKRSRSA